MIRHDSVDITAWSRDDWSSASVVNYPTVRLPSFNLPQQH